MDSATEQQGVQEAIAVAATAGAVECLCPNCEADVLKTGFVVQETRYRAYAPQGNILRRSRAASSGFEVAHCLLCSERLMVPVKELTKAA